ncbi:MAG: hypothetical protein J7527_18430 [Chitinophagaceae bacterium]|nr:hypothetical protein [Chitinophagaceae bacterium]
MLLTNLLTKESIEGVIESISDGDFDKIQHGKDQFDKFDWNAYRGKEVYKLRIANEERILGLMHLVDHLDPAINAIEIALLEVSCENIGANKIIGNIAGCMIAFACGESFKRGHDGFIFLVPKTELIDHYHERYGFIHLPIKTIGRPDGLMVLEPAASRRLITKYLDEY